MSLIVTSKTHSKIERWVREACHDNNMPELHEGISYTFNKRLTNIYGRASLEDKLIELSPLLWISGAEEERKDTVIHETCHIIVYYKYGYNKYIRHHGIEWKTCMTLAGLNPDRKYYSKVLL